MVFLLETPFPMSDQRPQAIVTRATRKKIVFNLSSYCRSQLMPRDETLSRVEMTSVVEKQQLKSVN